MEQPNPANPGGLVFRSGTDLASDPLVAQVLRGSYDARGDKWIGYRGSPPSALAAAGPVLTHDQVVGGILLATPLSTVLGEMRSESMSDVTLLDQDGQVIGSTLPGLAKDLLDEHTRGYLDPASPGRAARRTTEVGQSPYEFQFTLFYLRQRPVGYLAVALSRQSVVLPGADARIATAVAERIREAAGRPLVIEGRVISTLSMSLGVATYPRDSSTREALVQAADRALYLAKRAGRNRVARAHDPTEETLAS